MKFKNKTQKLFYENNSRIIESYKKYIERGKILLVGHGLGYEYHIIQQYNPEVVGLDVDISEGALHKKKIQLYAGDIIPYTDNEFDTVICSYVLHHSKDPKKLFSELARVSKETIIVTEETHDSLLQKIRSVFNCWMMNRKAGQTVHINWKSYLHTDTLKALIIENNLEVELHKKEDKGVHIYEFLILKKDDNL